MLRRTVLFLLMSKMNREQVACVQAAAEPEKAELAQDAKAPSPADLVAGRLAAAASAAAAAAAPLANNLS